MSRLARLIALLGLMVSLAGGMAPNPGAAQPPETAFDIADVPLPAQYLPEDGYQVLAGGFLDRGAAATWIADPRVMAPAAVESELEDAGWLQTYVLDLVLLEDRAFAPSDILALVQTNVYLLPDEAGAGRVYELMADFAGNDDADQTEPAVNDSVTVSLRSQSGDTMRTIFQRERTVVEVVTLAGFDFVDPEEHRLVALGTLDRLHGLHDVGEPGIATRAARLEDGEQLADFQNVQQSGVHHLYRIRDGVIQPAAGELGVPAPAGIVDGVVQIYHGSEAMRFGNSGTGFLSTWIGEFESSASAAAFMDTLAAGDPSAALFDPYFRIAAGEQAVSQGVEGLYRVTGVLDGEDYSGNLEIRQDGPYVVAIGFRTLGRALPAVDVTSRVMDHQLQCLGLDIICTPLDISDMLEAPSATPVIPSGGAGMVTSAEFGWSVRTDNGDWTVNERFAEPGYDVLELQSGRSLMTLESVINQHGDPVQCVIDELEALQELEGSAVIILGSDMTEAPAGSEPGHAWAIYAVEPLADERADQEYTVRFDCYALVEGGANLVVTHRAPRELWPGEREKGSALRETITFSGSRVQMLYL